MGNCLAADIDPKILLGSSQQFPLPWSFLAQYRHFFLFYYLIQLVCFSHPQIEHGGINEYLRYHDVATFDIMSFGEILTRTTASIWRGYCSRNNPCCQVKRKYTTHLYIPRWQPSLLSLESFHFLFLVVRHNLDMENTKRPVREVGTTTLWEETNTIRK